MEGVSGLVGVLGLLDPDWAVLVEEGMMEVVKPVGACEVTTEAEAPVLPLPLPVPEPEPLPEPVAQDPTGAAVPALSLVTSGPGLGNRRSDDSRVVQPVPVLATNISGRAEKATAAVPEPAVIVTLAQFMYISRFPTLLNQVQAKTAGPAFASAGTVNL